jgi:hypothetical protein
MKFRPVGAEVFHEEGRRTDVQTDRWTDVTELLVAFRNITNVPKKMMVITL